MNILLLCFVTHVVAELQTMHRVFISRRDKVNAQKPPFDGTTSFQDPLVYSTLNTVLQSDVKSLSQEKYSASKPNRYSKTINQLKLNPNRISTQSKRDLDAVTPSIQYDHRFLPSKIKTDIMYEQLKSAMHYKPTANEYVSGYYDGLGYQSDEDDVRSSSRSTYDSYPYYYHNPYEYEHMKFDAELQKAKDKRYAADTTHRTIPIHEDLSDDVPNSYEYSLKTAYGKTSENPMGGHDPFFRFVLNDYFDKNSDEDHLSFKGLDWGKEFDHDSLLTDLGEVSRRNRRLEDNNSYVPNSVPVTEAYYNSKNIKSTQGEAVTEKAYNKKHDFDKSEKGNAEKNYEKSAHEKQGNHYTGFKDFLDAFANKFGSEDHKKDSKFLLKREQDKGEKRKGFRRVYHKDEYQEDNEFYDNNNHKAQSEEKGNASEHSGGSEGLLKSQAAAAIGNDAKAYNKIGDKVKNSYENNHKGYEKMHGFDGGYNRYIDVAKLAAQSNDADYSDHFRI